MRSPAMLANSDASSFIHNNQQRTKANSVTALNLLNFLWHNEEHGFLHGARESTAVRKRVNVVMWQVGANLFMKFLCGRFTTNRETEAPSLPFYDMTGHYYVLELPPTKGLSHNVMSRASSSATTSRQKVVRKEFVYTD